MLNFPSLAALNEQLDSHPVYAAVQDIADLRCFMEHHIYSVWDFMSLVKYVQGEIAPASVPWVPRGDPSVRRFINEIVLGEESDLGLPAADGSVTYLSHYELYCDAMRDVGADPGPAQQFVAMAAERGIAEALAKGPARPAARQFVASTFEFIASGKPHVVAAALALGREHIIPGMFRALLAGMGIEEKDAPAFHYYLERHIHLDEDSHGPLSMRMLEEFCGGDPVRVAEAETAARKSIEARIRFWDGVHAAILEK